MEECRKCRYFIPMHNRCVLHGKNDEIVPGGWCKYFTKGEPGSRGSEPKGLVTKSQSEYVNDAKESMKK